MSSRRDGQIYKKFMGVIVRMELSENLKDQFAKMVNNKSDSNSNSDDVNYGTVKVYSDGTKAVILDGSNIATPFETVTDAEDGDRVTVRVKNHKAVITGNLSSPAARTDAVKANSNKIGKFNTVLADKVGTDELDAQIGRINTLVSDNTIIKQKLSASEGEFKDIKTKQLEVEEKVTAAEADIKSIKTDKIDASIVKSQYTKTKDFEALRGTVGTLSGDFSIFKNTTTDKLNATDAEIKKLDTDKLNATDAALKFANIDFSNIGVAAMQYFYAQSGLIKDVVVGNQTITGELVGVTIKGDLIDGNTIVADKLVIKGEDGLYYKLNTDGMTTEVEQTDFNSINGSVIRAKSITASKMDVKDLVAFDATIAGFKIDNTAIHSIGKESAISSVRGIYLSKDGQMAVGDSEHYIKYYKDTDGNYKLAISAESVTLSTGKTIEETVNNIQTKVDSFDNLSKNVYRRNEVDTKISQTKEAIELSASNIYQRQDAMGNYYTVSQTDAAIKARGDAIELKVNGIQVGGRNLLQESGNFASFSKWKKYGSSASQILEVVTEDGYKIMHTFGNSSQMKMIYQLEWGTEYAYHAVMKFANAGSFDNHVPLHYWIYKTNISNTMSASNGAHNIESINVYECDSGKTVTSIAANVWYHIVCVFKTIFKPSDYKYVLFRPFIYDSGSIVGGNKEYWLRWIKLEKGNKPTDWTPAPEDVDNSISTVDSKFKDYATTASLSMYLSKTDTGQLKSMIEAIADTINITAKGGLNLKGNRFSVESTNLTITNDGSMACKNVAITGGNIDLTSAKYDDGLIRIKSKDNVCSNVITSQGFETHNSKIGLKYGYDGIMITYPGIISPGIINVSTNGNVTGNFKKINTNELDVGTMSVSNMYTSVGYNLFNCTWETQSTDWKNGFDAQFHCSGTGLLLINANVWTDSTYDYGTTYCEIIYGGLTASMSTHRFTEPYGDTMSANATYAVWVENANNQSFVIKGGSSKGGTKYLRMNIQAIMGLSAWRG